MDENISAEGQEFDCSQVKCSKGAVNEYKRLGKVDSDGLNKLSVAGHCVTTGGQSVTH